MTLEPVRENVAQGNLRLTPASHRGGEPGLRLRDTRTRLRYALYRTCSQGERAEKCDSSQPGAEPVNSAASDLAKLEPRQRSSNTQFVGRTRSGKPSSHMRVGERPWGCQENLILSNRPSQLVALVRLRSFQLCG